MGRFRNPAVVPQGMLAPSGMAEDEQIDPFVQSTTRPAGSLLRPSPGFDSIRVGKNRFQGKGPTGGFRPFEFAEDVGGTGAALAVRPGDTSTIEATEWLPEDEDSMPEGSLIISDRRAPGSVAVALHEGEHAPVDMGDRHPSRPLSKWLVNPAAMLRSDYAENPVITVLATAGVVFLAYIIGNDLEREYVSRRGRGVAAETTAAPAAAAATSGDEVDRATQTVGDAADKAVTTIEKAADSAIEAIEDAGKAAKDGGKKAADITE
jgi:hypothetical protein